MLFEWDGEKNEANIAKHGVSFQLALRIFEGVVWTADADRPDLPERRRVSVGAVEGVALLAVVHTDRQGRVRIISARPASRRERRMYEQNTRSAHDDR